MTDYIKREDLLNALNAQRIEYNAAVNETIIKLPSADVVEVVRCKDCRHWKENHRKEKYCNKFGYLFGINDFCSYGERAE